MSYLVKEKGYQHMGKKTSIASVGFEIPGNSGLLVGFNSKKSLMDYDIIVFKPSLPYYQRSVVDGGEYLGKTCYGDSGSFQLKEDIAHWKKELQTALQSGKTVFFFLSDRYEFFLDSGRREFSGSGRNRVKTINVDLGNNYELLPVNLGQIVSASGKHIEFSGFSLFSNFFKKFKDYLEYKLYLEKDISGQVLFTGKDKSKILGVIPTTNNGFFVALPDFVYDEEELTTTKENKKGQTETFWTKAAIKMGSELIDAFVEIDGLLKKGTDKTPPPDWAANEDYVLKKEKEIIEKIENNKTSIQKLKLENERLFVNLESETILKGLLFEQGKPLEQSVINALEILGFKAENYDDGELELDQVIISPENVRFIGECEGKDTKDINIDKLRQLVESLNADAFRDEVDERASGILFGNAQRLVEPNERTLDFTDKCKKSADREKIALVKTVDLFKVAKYLSETDDNEYKKLCREAIILGFGKIVEFPPIPLTTLNTKSEIGNGTSHELTTEVIATQ